MNFASRTLGSALSLALLGGLAAAQNTNYILSADSTSASPGEVATITIRLTNTGADLAGYSFSLSVPPELIIQDFRPGTDLQAMNAGAGPDFYAGSTYPGEGVTAGVVISFMGTDRIGQATDMELHQLDLLVDPALASEQVFSLDFVDTIGSPPVVTIVATTLGVSEDPVRVSGSVDASGNVASYCSGDGSAGLCPCGNPGGTGRGCANGASAIGARLSSTGSTSIAADDLAMSCVGLVPNQPGLYFRGVNAVNGGAGTPFGDGLRCAGGGVRRLQVRFADSTGSSSMTIPIGAASLAQAGDQHYFQCWYRDPVTSPCGAGFNLTNGLAVTWLP